VLQYEPAFDVSRDAPKPRLSRGRLRGWSQHRPRLGARRLVVLAEQDAPDGAHREREQYAQPGDAA
jgi:hypothetical protein